MNEEERDKVISNMMDLSLTFEPLRDFIAGEKARMIESGFSEEVSEQMCAHTWSFLMENMINEIRKNG